MEPSATPSSDSRAGFVPSLRSHHILSIGGMTCAGCAGRVEKALTAVKSVIRADVNLAMNSASVTVQGRGFAEIVLLQAVEDAGFTAKTINNPLSDPNDHDHDHSDHQRLRCRLLISATLSLPFIVEMGVMFTSSQMLVTPGAQWALATPILIIAWKII